MLEKFTANARRVVVLAQEESRDLGHGYLGTEHLLLGLIRAGGGAEILAGSNVGLEDVRRRVEQIVGRASQGDSGQMLFTPRAKTVLEMSMREAIELGHESIHTEHILLALLREGAGVAAQILTLYDVGLAGVRRQVVARLGAQPES